MPLTYLAIGTTLAGMVNTEVTYGVYAHALDNALVPLVGPIRRRTLGQTVVRNGTIDAPLQFDTALFTELDALILAQWTNYTTPSASKFVSWYAEDGHISPFAVTLERPVVGEHYDRLNNTWTQRVTIPGLDWVIQIDSVSSSGAVTTSQRYIQYDTSGGVITADLPAVAGVTPYTIYSHEKYVAGNTLTLDPNSTEQIAGASTLVVTDRVDIYTDGSAWYVQAGS